MVALIFFFSYFLSSSFDNPNQNDIMRKSVERGELEQKERVCVFSSESKLRQEDSSNDFKEFHKRNVSENGLSDCLSLYMLVFLQMWFRGRLFTAGNYCQFFIGYS